MVKSVGERSLITFLDAAVMATYGILVLRVSDLSKIRLGCLYLGFSIFLESVRSYITSCFRSSYVGLLCLIIIILSLSLTSILLGLYSDFMTGESPKSIFILLVSDGNELSVIGVDNRLQLSYRSCCSYCS